MSLLKKIAVALVVLIASMGVLGLAAWKFVQREIALNAHAPHLTRVAEAAEDFPFHTLDGQPKRLSDVKGKVIFLDLWGTWCIQCVAEMPTVQKLYDHYRGDPGVVFLIVSRLGSPAAVRRYASRNHFDLPFYTMDDNSIPQSMQLDQYPATFLYAPDGKLAAKHVSAADWSAPSVIEFINGLKHGR